MNYQKQIINGVTIIAATSTRRDEIAGLKTALDKQGYIIVTNKQSNIYTLRARKTQ